MAFQGRSGGRGKSQLGPKLPNSFLQNLQKSKESKSKLKKGASRKDKRRAKKDEEKAARIDYFEKRSKEKKERRNLHDKFLHNTMQADLAARQLRDIRSPSQAQKTVNKPNIVKASSGAMQPKPSSKLVQAKRPRTRFEELLAEGFEGRSDSKAFEEELRLQRSLEKKLGIKGGKKPKMSDEDGLEDLLKGISSADISLASLKPKPSPAAQEPTLSSRISSKRKLGTIQARDKPAAVSTSENGRLRATISSDRPAKESSLRGVDVDSEGVSDDDEDISRDVDDDLMDDLKDSGSDEEEVGEEGEEDEDEDSQEEAEEEDMMLSDSEDDFFGMGEDEEDQEGEEEEVGSDGSSDGDGSSSDEDDGEQDGEEMEEGSTRVRIRSALGASTSAAQEAVGTIGVAAALGGAKYVPPALRKKLEASDAGASASGVERRIIGLLNRLAESNVQSIVKDVVGLYASEGRRLVTSVVVQQILSAASEGPRATEQFAAIAAAFVSSLAAGCQSQEMGASFLAELADKMEEAYKRKDSLALHNLVMVMSHLYSCGLVRSDVVYSLLHKLRDRLSELDVDMVVSVLGSVGLQLRNEDPAAMKDFVVGVHARAAELGQQGALTKRAQLMLDLVVDVKNNRKSADSGGSGGKRAASVLSPGVLKWLRQSGVEEVQLRNITWEKLLDKSKRKGMWWLPAAGESSGGVGAGSLHRLPGRSGLGPASDDATEVEEQQALLKLAAEQRMNTDVRRAVFMAVMGSEDCIEAHEKLLRLPLKGEQEREVVRVLLHCCLSEQSWNPYYALLAVKLAKSSKSHRMTLQFSLWDHYKGLADMQTAQLSSLAKLNAVLIAKGALSLSMLKVVDFNDLSARQLFFWRLFFRHLLQTCKDSGEIKDVFARAAAARKQEPKFLPALLLFIKSDVGPWLAMQGTSVSTTGISNSTTTTEPLHNADVLGGTSKQPGTLHQDAKLDELMRRVRLAERTLEATSAGRQLTRE